MGGWGQSLKRHLKSEGSPPSTTRVTLVLVGRFFFLMKPCKGKSGPAKWKISDQIKFYCFCQLHHHSYSPGHFSLPQIFPFWMIFSQSMPKYQRCHCQWCKIPKKNSKHNGICFTYRIKQTLSLCCILVGLCESRSLVSIWTETYWWIQISLQQRSSLDLWDLQGALIFRTTERSKIKGSSINYTI